MPYEWVQPDGPNAPKAELHLWPYRSLPRLGFVWIMGMGFGLMLLPLLGVVGTMALWGLLPFGLAALGALWFFIEKSYRDAEILEELRIWPDLMTLTRHGPRGKLQEWEANPFWVSVQLHKSSGPVPDYVTLKGNGREVEIGAFLSEDERPSMHNELEEVLARTKSHS